MSWKPSDRCPPAGSKQAHTSRNFNFAYRFSFFSPSGVCESVYIDHCQSEVTANSRAEGCRRLAYKVRKNLGATLFLREGDIAFDGGVVIGREEGARGSQ